MNKGIGVELNNFEQEELKLELIFLEQTQLQLNEMELSRELFGNINNICQRINEEFQNGFLKIET